MTLLVAPIAGFYAPTPDNPGTTQIRLALVCPDEELQYIPQLLVTLYKHYVQHVSKST
jgi:hypothetical protein